MKTILTIAGSDSSGGAGMQADIKTAEHFGVFSTTAITALAAQNTTGVQKLLEVDGDFVYEQIHSIMEDIRIDAIKIGMLYSSEIVGVVKEILSKVTVPVVLDPIYGSKVGSILVKEDAVRSLDELFAYVTLITPNVHEAKIFFGEELNINAPCPVLVKNIQSQPKSIDRLFYANNISVDFEGEFLESKSLHGTGCSFSAAIASNLALGYELEESIREAKDFIQKAIAQAPNIGNGIGPIRHRVLEQ